MIFGPKRTTPPTSSRQPRVVAAESLTVRPLRPVLPVLTALLALLLLQSLPLKAASLACEPGSRPLLEVLAFYSPTQPPQSPPLPDSRQAFLLCQNRNLLRTDFRSALASEVPLIASVTQGVVTRPSWSELGAAMVAARIGLAKSCWLVSPPLLRRAEIEITWHGAGARSNKFHLSSVDSSLPACPPEVEDLWWLLLTLDLETGSQQALIH